MALCKSQILKSDRELTSHRLNNPLILSCLFFHYYFSLLFFIIIFIFFFFYLVITDVSQLHFLSQSLRTA